jgi:hypothetical protein
VKIRNRNPIRIKVKRRIRITLMLIRNNETMSVDDLLDPVDDPVCLVPPVDGGLHPVLQQRVQHPVLLHRVRVHALKYLGFYI